MACFGFPTDAAGPRPAPMLTLCLRCPPCTCERRWRARAATCASTAACALCASRAAPTRGSSSRRWPSRWGWAGQGSAGLWVGTRVGSHVCRMLTSGACHSGARLGERGGGRLCSSSASMPSHPACAFPRSQPHIVVATPGRLLDLVQDNSLSLGAPAAPPFVFLTRQPPRKRYIRICMAHACAAPQPPAPSMHAPPVHQ